jgi:hypothetical protein
MPITLDGSLGITTPALTVTGTATFTGVSNFGTGTVLPGATNPVVAMTGAANNYIQSYIFNSTNGVNSSADFTAYPSNGTDVAGWVDMGITSPSFNQSTYSVTGPNEAYLFGSAPSGSGTTGNLVIATDSTGTSNAIQFYTGGFAQAKSAAKMVILSSGNVGIGTTSPVTGLSVYKSNGYVQLTDGTIDFRNFVWAGGTAAATGTWSNHPLLFNTNNTERMRINSSGQITNSYNPAFFSIFNTATYTAGQTFTGSLTGTNPSTRSSYYSNGTFTAPVAGYYQFNFQVYDFNSNNASYAVFKNGSGYVPSDWFQMVGGNPMLAWSFVLYLNAGDYIQMGIRAGSISIYGGHSYWSGFLIG